jgi:DNA replication protein DnaC
VRTETDVEVFQQQASLDLENCPKCKGDDAGCDCVLRCELHKRAFESGIPQDFWDITPDDVEFNKDAFDEVVRPYARKLGTALRRGYGLLFLGDNGTGKTMFLSYVLLAACRRNFSAYYTTMTQLAYDTKLGFGDREAQRRLAWYLTSDFLAIDEMGKERFKTGDTFMRTELERILKQRYDDAKPTLIATNMDMVELDKLYGATLSSMLVGKYEQVVMEPGDFRENLRKRMQREMGKK